jgi:hypothetical protein
MHDRKIEFVVSDLPRYHVACSFAGIWGLEDKNLVKISKSDNVFSFRKIYVDWRTREIAHG